MYNTIYNNTFFFSRNIRRNRSKIRVYFFKRKYLRVIFMLYLC